MGLLGGGVGGGEEESKHSSMLKARSGTRFPRVRATPKPGAPSTPGLGACPSHFPQSFHPAWVFYAGGRGCPVELQKPTDGAKGKRDSLSQNIREEGEGRDETPQAQDSKERLKTLSPARGLTTAGHLGDEKPGLCGPSPHNLGGRKGSPPRASGGRG